ncbi:hypothetical protein [Sphingomonas sp. Leaf357]|uniref:hypothetical protein n=1 Tax=Sphingomonas sp. Leaf357 TaxID=1736350 RepID=UPI0009EBD89A|nr:hypothetical protein [Sphingomonas sp. Leaf357]
MTSFDHVPLALGVQIASWVIGRSLKAPTEASIWTGCFAGAAVCIMREITQREYQWIEKFGAGRRANMPGLEGLKFWEWNSHSIYETLIAIAASVILAIIVSVMARR